MTIDFENESNIDLGLDCYAIVGDFRFPGLYELSL